jgi:hypothetical protein
MSFGVNEGKGSPFGAIGMTAFLLIGGVLMLVGECGSCMGIEHWDTPSVTEQAQESKQKRRSKEACTAQCQSDYPKTWKEPDFTLYPACVDAC